MNNGKRNGNQIINLGLVLAAIGAAMLIASTLGGCDRSYLPWTSNPWPKAATETTETPERVPQDPPENFCEDMHESVEQYRRFLAPGYVWEGSPASIERRQKYCREFVEQYDRLC